MENRNFITALALSLMVVIAYQNFFVLPEMERQAALERQAAEKTTVVIPVAEEEILPREEVLNQGNRIFFENENVKGSIALKGGRIDDLSLKNYRVELNGDELVHLLSPKKTQAPYFADFGWVGPKATKTPSANTVWKVKGANKTITKETPVTLSWDNGEGFTFEREISLDDDYMFIVTQRIVNNGKETKTFYPYGLLTRVGTPETEQNRLVHEGLLGVMNDTLVEITYDDMQDRDGEGAVKVISEPSQGGWIGVTDKYWLAALAPDQAEAVKFRLTHRKSGTRDQYQTDYLGNAISVVPGQTVSNKTYLFAGAKELAALDRYEHRYGLTNFDLAIDFGWFYFLTKPLLYVLLYFNALVGKFGVALLILTVMVRLALFPLANKSYRSMGRMREVQPQMKKLMDRFKDDKQRLNQELIELYKKEKINPAAGCLPLIIQMPIFFALYKVLYIAIEMRHQPFFGWIQDLSVPDPTNLFNLFGFAPWDFALFSIGAWPILMGITMYFQQKLMPTPAADPIQMRILRMLPFVFVFILAGFPSGLVIYWTWSNILSILQQWVLLKERAKS